VHELFTVANVLFSFQIGVPVKSEKKNGWNNVERKIIATYRAKIRPRSRVTSLLRREGKRLVHPRIGTKEENVRLIGIIALTGAQPVDFRLSHLYGVRRISIRT
jgi:hypothetical protein